VLQLRLGLRKREKAWIRDRRLKTSREPADQRSTAGRETGRIIQTGCVLGTKNVENGRRMCRCKKSRSKGRLVGKKDQSIHIGWTEKGATIRRTLFSDTRCRNQTGMRTKKRCAVREVKQSLAATEKGANRRRPRPLGTGHILGSTEKKNGHDTIRARKNGPSPNRHTGGGGSRQHAGRLLKRNGANAEGVVVRFASDRLRKQLLCAGGGHFCSRWRKKVVKKIHY